MKTLSLIIIALSLTMSQPAEAQSWTSGTELVLACYGRNGSNESERFANQAICLGYLIGITDAIPLIKYNSPHFAVCLPSEGISGVHVAEALAKDIVAHPSSGLLSPRVAVLHALMLQYPCQTVISRVKTKNTSRYGVITTPSMSHGSSYPGIVHVRGYFRKNGTYVQPHYRTSSDHTRLNNWSHHGNINPFTGKRGYRR